MKKLERALQHGRELVQPFPREHPLELKVTYLKSLGADVAAMIPPQRLLVSCCSQCGFLTALLPQHEVHPPLGVLLHFIKR